ncbi:hypothetical protein [Paracoccus benzoatiresistens]|uniref:Uncharacterized protein n=1 Tax=Paracoccus benzoatiresistens TaxID=2997341 RepID=A0ABT4J907_9RHOB|nr:hypothetical protein [Paracoccus sp. EF6]MCZ0963580.1 hypothetical protein [Paracoccus sp. EF6]
MLINPKEISRQGLTEGQAATLEGALEDGHDRVVRRLRVVDYDLPDGCVAACHREMNPLVPVHYRDKLSHTPACKGAPLRIRPEDDGAGARAAG